MPTDLQQPLVTTDHPWQHNRPLDSCAVPKTDDSHQGWLDTPLVNTIMHSPNLPIHSSHSPATPSTVLGHLIGKPIQPQPILPQPASQSALGSAEKPKSSKINLSDNSAFTVISSTQKQQSVPKATVAPGSYEVRSSSLSGSTKSKAMRGLFDSVTSPVSSELPSIHGDHPHMWEEILLREQFAATAGTSISSLAASNQELAMVNRDTPVENRNPYMNQIYQQISNRPKCAEVPCFTQWPKKIQLDTEYIAGPVSSWMQQF